MTTKRRLTIGWRMGLVLAAIMAAFWGVWSIFAPVPPTIGLPWFSRWWDVPFVIPCTILYVWIFSLLDVQITEGLNNIHNSPDETVLLCCSLISTTMSIVCGMIFGLIYPLLLFLSLAVIVLSTTLLLYVAMYTTNITRMSWRFCWRRGGKAVANSLMSWIAANDADVMQQTGEEVGDNSITHLDEMSCRQMPTSNSSISQARMADAETAENDKKDDSIDEILTA